MTALIQDGDHINDNDLDSRFGTTDSFPERIKCISAFAGDEVKNRGQIPMPFANIDFVNSNLFELTELWARKTPHQIAFLDILNNIPAYIKMLGRIQNGHMSG